MPVTMDPPQTDIEIISQAAQLCGKGNFNTIDSGGEFAINAASFYGTLVTAELGSNRWRFALHNQSTGLLNALVPDFEGWSFYWDLPADLLMLHRVDPFVIYTVFGERLVTTGSQAITAIYSRSVAVSKWPPAFKMYMVYALADMLAVSVTLSDRIVARIQTGLNTWEARALFADGQSSPPRTLRYIPYQAVRQ